MLDTESPNLPDRLRARLSEPLPGRTVHRDYAPQTSYGRHNGPAGRNARQASVLVLVYPQDGCWSVSLTRRPLHLRDHAGQISFPGGALENGESIEQGALRELEEELAVTVAPDAVLGRLSPLYVFGTNFWVVPCVAVADRRPDFVPNPEEVADLLEPAISDLMDPAALGWETINYRGLKLRAPAIHWQGNAIWGATCMMLGELLHLVAVGA